MKNYNFGVKVKQVKIVVVGFCGFTLCNWQLLPLHCYLLIENRKLIVNNALGVNVKIIISPARRTLTINVNLTEKANI